MVGLVPVKDVDISEEEWPALEQPVMRNESVVSQRLPVVPEETDNLSYQLSG